MEEDRESRGQGDMEKRKAHVCTCTRHASWVHHGEKGLYFRYVPRGRGLYFRYHRYMRQKRQEEQISYLRTLITQTNPIDIFRYYFTLKVKPETML